MDPTQSQAIAKQLSPEKIMEVGLSCFSSKVLLTAVELRVFTILSKQQMTGEELGKLLSLHPRGIYDFLDALVALGFLRREGTGAAGRYSNSPESALFLDRSEPTYRGGILERVNARLYGFWNDLGTALKTGAPQNELKRSEKPLFETLYSDPARLEQFMDAMRGISGPSVQALAEKFDFSKYQTLCDVGGRVGRAATALYHGANRPRRLLLEAAMDLSVALPVASLVRDRLYACATATCV